MSEQISVDIDIGSCAHAIAVMNPDGEFCNEFTISHDHVSFYEAGQRIMNIAHQFNLPVVAHISSWGRPLDLMRTAS